MSLLVTGASGFIGLHALEWLLAEGRQVVAFSAQPVARGIGTHLRGLGGELTEILGDVREGPRLAQIMMDHRVDQVLHLAAVTSGRVREQREAEEILSVNLAGLASVITAAALSGVRTFLYAGSVAVFGGGEDGSLLEEHTPHAPRTLYGISKSAGEAVVAHLGDLHGFDWIVGRLGRVFGPYEHDSGVRDTLSQIHVVTRSALAGRPVVIDRPCVKNWSYARDAASCLARLLAADSHRHRIYNLGSPHVWPLSAWCERLERHVPGFRFAVGDGTGERVDLGGATDGGLLSWQRFGDEFGTPARFDLDTAFDDYMRTLERLS